jgi:Polyketide cyclase / dehydrase and lipid transport
MRLGIPSNAAKWLAAVVLVLLPTVSAADTLDPDAARIAAAKHSLEWNWTPPGRAERYGHAETLIHAPLDVVRARVLDFSHYTDISHHFKMARVIAYGADHTVDVFLRIGVLHDIVMLWDVARFSPIRDVSPGVQVLEGRMVPGRGNVRDMDAVWTMRALDDEWTLLKFDLLLKPGIPAPQFVVDETLRDAARDAVDLIHYRAQGTRKMEAWPAPAESVTTGSLAPDHASGLGCGLARGLAPNLACGLALGGPPAAAQL